MHVYGRMLRWLEAHTQVYLHSKYIYTQFPSLIRNLNNTKQIFRLQVECFLLWGNFQIHLLHSRVAAAELAFSEFEQTARTLETQTLLLTHSTPKVTFASAFPGSRTVCSNPPIWLTSRTGPRKTSRSFGGHTQREHAQCLQLFQVSLWPRCFFLSTEYLL